MPYFILQTPNRKYKFKERDNSAYIWEKLINETIQKIHQNKNNLIQRTIKYMFLLKIYFFNQMIKRINYIFKYLIEELFNKY